MHRSEQLIGSSGGIHRASAASFVAEHFAAFASLHPGPEAAAVKPFNSTVTTILHGICPAKRLLVLVFWRFADTPGLPPAAYNNREPPCRQTKTLSS